MKSLLIIFLLLFDVCFYAQETDLADSSDNRIYNVLGVGVKPEFPGSFQNEVVKHLILPAIDKELDIKLYITFVVEKDGSMSNIKCIRESFGLCNSAIMALQTITTKWKPGMINGLPVRVSHILPLIVKIDDPTAKKEEINKD